MNMDLETVKKEIRSILLTFQKGCLLTEFNCVYKEMLGSRLPFRDFSFQSDVEFLKSMPDVVSLRPDRSGDYLLKGIADEKSQHIQNLVCKQKPSKQKAPSRSRVISNSKMTSSFKTSAVSSSSLSSTDISKPPSNSRRIFSIPPRFNSFLKTYISKDHMQEAVELVLSFPDGLRLSNFMSEFEKLYGRKFPFRSLGYATLDKCLESIPNLILEPIDNDTLIYHVSFIENSGRAQSDMPKSFLTDRELMHKERNRQTSVSDKSENYNSVTDRESMHKERNGETFVSDKSENYNSMTDYTLNGDKESVQALSFSKGSLGHLNLSSRSEDRPALSENMRKKCVKLLERYPNGMYASNFPSYFEEVNLVTFDLHSLGYHSLADFIDDHPDIFMRTSIAGSKKDWVIYPANSRDTTAVENVNLSNGSIFHIESIILNTRKILQGYPEGLTLDNFLHVYSINCNEPLYVKDLGFDKLEHFLLSIAERVPLKVEMSGNSKTVHFVTYDDIPIKPPVSAPVIFEKEALPSDAAFPDSKFVLLQLPADFDYSKYMPVYTSSVFNPDLIYLQVQGTDTTDALAVLSEDLDSFYRGSLSNSYKMKNAHIKVGAACAALWPGDNHWYRAKIMSIPSMEMVQLFYVDYGTKEVVPVSLLRYIRQKYMKLPAQALKSRLAFLKPKEQTWNLAVKKRILSLCQDVSLMAKIEERSVDGTLSVILCDTNGEQDIYINDILLKEGFAENALYSQLGGQAAYEINSPPFQAEGAQHFQRNPYTLGSLPSTVNDVALTLLQKLALCYAHNPQLKQQHIQSGLLNPFFNLPSSTMLGNPNPVMNPLIATTGLVGLSPLSPSYVPSAYLGNMSEYPSPPSAELNRQPVKSKSPSSKEVKETKKPSPDDSENSDVFDDDDDDRFLEFYEKVLSPVRKRLIKRINFGNGYVMHIIVWNSLPYASSGDISALIWYNKEADYLFRRLQLKEITFPVVDVFEEGNEELFNQLKRYNVKGIQKVTSSKSCVHLYPLSCVIKILNMFGHPSASLRVRIVDEISSFNLSDPIWQEFSESEANEKVEVEVPETDDDKISRLCLFDLLAMKEGIRCRRLKMVNKLNGPENSQCVEEIEKLEQLHEKVLERIQEIKEVCELFS